MTTPDYRALCAELVDAYAWCIDEYMTAPSEEDALICKARAHLTAPEAVEVTDQELLRLAAQAFGYEMKDGGIGGGESEFLAFARAILARWGAHPSPVPVGERLPGNTDLNLLGMCWWYDRANGSWVECDRTYGAHAGYTCWLPHWALPLPEAQP